MRYFILLFLPFLGIGQNQNIIPNSGFENFSNIPLGWYHKGEHFTKTMKYWFSPTFASPDAYGPDVIVPENWAVHGFGSKKPYSGLSMVGLTLYGCKKGKPHCREYISVQLLEPLVKDQKYKLEFYVLPLSRSLRINNIGAAFSNDKPKYMTDSVIPVEVMVSSDKIIDKKSSVWKKLTYEFKATDNSNYIIIGNFLSDEDTKRSKFKEGCLNYSYYYFDEISLVKTEPIIAITESKDYIIDKDLSVGNEIVLNHVFFEFDKSELLPRSEKELNQLIKILNDFPEMKIEIQGHTDSKGGKVYNDNLSSRRANSVMSYLVDYGIAGSRLVPMGYGKSVPLASNSTDAGRELNRRVSIKILTPLEN